MIGTVLVAPPQGAGPIRPRRRRARPSSWSAQAGFAASVRVEGAGFVDRRPFVDGDETALTVGGPASWTVDEGELTVSGAGPGFALFGDPDWDHLTVVVGIGAGAASAGIGFGLDAAAAAPRGLFALVEVPAGGGPARLVVRRRETPGGPLAEAGAVELPAGVGTGTDPVAIEVTSFDDRLRASVGDAVVEVDHGEIRAGGCA